MLVGAVLRPQQREHGQLDVVRLAAEPVADQPVLGIGEPELPVLRFRGRRAHRPVIIPQAMPGPNPPGLGSPTTAANPTRIVFVGGTGRSGTHVVAQILGRHSELKNISNEVRFHCDPGGFPDLLAGRVSKEQFVDRLRGPWWRGMALHRFSFKGLHRHVPRDAFEAAIARFETAYDADSVVACRALFLELLMPIAAEEDKPGLVEMSVHTILEAPTLHRLFPEARFIHIVRDGRDAGASRVAQARWLDKPRTLKQGLEWWEERMRAIDAAQKQIPGDQYLAVSLDELIELKRRATYHRVRRFLELESEQAMWGFFRRQVSGGQGNVGRWRRRKSKRTQDEIDALYLEMLDRFEAEEINGWRMLRRVHEARA